MSPDLKRLCDAVEIVCNHHGMATCDEDHEAIARAVLLTMRDPTRPVVKAMCKAMSPEHRPTPDYIPVEEKHRVRWRAAIDHILSAEG